MPDTRKAMSHSSPKASVKQSSQSQPPLWSMEMWCSAFAELSTPKSYRCFLHKPPPASGLLSVCVHTYIQYIVLSHAGIPRVCKHEPVPVRWDRLEWYHAWGLVHGTCVSEVNACGRGLYVRVWRWAPDGWVVEIYRLTVALQCDYVGWERDVWLKCCCFHTVTHLSCGRFVLDGFYLGLLVTAGP